jgi:predicted permease
MIFSGNLDALYAVCTVSPTVDGAAVAMSLVVMLQQQLLAEAFIKRLLLRKLKKESSQSVNFFLFYFPFPNSGLMVFLFVCMGAELGKEGITNVLRDNRFIVKIMRALCCRQL